MILAGLCQDPTIHIALPHLEKHHALLLVGKAISVAANDISGRFESHENGLVRLLLQYTADEQELLPPDGSAHPRILSEWLSVADTLVVLLDSERADLSRRQASLPQALLQILIALTSTADQACNTEGELHEIVHLADRSVPRRIALSQDLRQHAQCRDIVDFASPRDVRCAARASSDPGSPEQPRYKLSRKR